MNPILKEKIIKEWTDNLPLNKKIIKIFEKVRDIPYGDTGSRDPEEVYQRNKGTCSGKHELLKELYKQLGINVKDFVAIHRFKDLNINFPENIKTILNRSDIIDPHNFIKILVNNKWVSIDATWDKPLEKLGFHVNKDWDGESNMKICVIPLKIIEVDNMLEFKKKKIDELPKKIQEDRKLFLKELTFWLENLRENKKI